MATSLRDKGERFRTLHAGPDTFLMPNPWDAGSARILAGLGFPALATSSGAFAGTLGRRDGQVTRDEAIAHARAIVDAVDLPVSADFENGFGDSPETVAETIRLAGAEGLAGCSIEDANADRHRPPYDFSHSVERIAAAAEAARQLDFPFTLTARAEGSLRGAPDLDEIVRRLQAYAAAGADVLMAPGLADLASVRTVCAALDKPFSFMVGIPGRSFDVAALVDAGVRRISLATALYRFAMSALVEGAREAKEKGTFGFVDRALPTADLSALMS